MNTKFEKNDVVQFVETHKWCPCFGIIEEIKDCGDDIRYMVGVPTPSNDDSTPVAYIFVMESDDAIEYVGKAVMISANS